MIETAGHFKGLQPFVNQFKEAGAYIVHKCTQIRHAKSAEKMGVDMISMDGQRPPLVRVLVLVLLFVAAL